MTQVLEQDPVNVKALYRRCQAYLKTSDLEKAEADIKRALIIDPNNRYNQLHFQLYLIHSQSYAKKYLLTKIIFYEPLPQTWTLDMILALTHIHQ